MTLSGITVCLGLIVVAVAIGVLVGVAAARQRYEDGYERGYLDCSLDHIRGQVMEGINNDPTG